MTPVVLRVTAGVIAGGLVGYGYHRLSGCRSGACPIAGNPFVATLYGAFLGVVIALGR